MPQQSVIRFLGPNAPKIIGKIKAWTYVGFLVLFSTLSGLAYGAWVDGVPIAWIILANGGSVGVLVTALHFVDKRQAPTAA